LRVRAVIQTPALACPTLEHFTASDLPKTCREFLKDSKPAIALQGAMAGKNDVGAELEVRREPGIEIHEQRGGGRSPPHRIAPAFKTFVPVELFCLVDRRLPAAYEQP
jgi:hypothetical protein